MVDKVGRNDPCPCGSGKKYKNCCLKNEQPRTSSLGKRKFTAKVLNAGGLNKAQVQENMEQSQIKASVDYATLMERSFGEALHSHEDKPPTLENPSSYLAEDKPQEPPSQ